MDINRLYEFITLAECLNYSKAAQQLYITQPVLSRHIHDLENNVGAQLLVRNTHSVELTPIGRLFVNEATDIIERYESALKKVNDAAHGTIGYLKIGFLSAAVEPFLRDFVLKFRQEQPAIQLDFEAMSLDELQRALDSNQVDVAFASHMATDSSTALNVRRIWNDELILAVSNENPLSKWEQIHIEDLSDMPLIFLSKEENPMTFRFHEEMFANHGANLLVSRFAPNLETALFFTSLNQGSFIMPLHLSHMITKNVTAIPIADEDSFLQLNLVWKKKNMNPVTEIFVDSFEKFGKDHSSRDFH
jgi:DNA-binding transcriptional LysR family regulator